MSGFRCWFRGASLTAPWCLGAMLGLHASALHSEEMVGSIGGAFSVDAGGRAAYAIPILAVPASGGVRPSVGLAYTSGASRRWAGEGWGLTGFSSIERCAKTLAQDGVIAQVAYDHGDRFCLDGARLVLESGEYGAADSTYRTEVDQFLRITARQSGAQVPAYFEVQRRDGTTVVYGKEATTRIEVQGTGAAGPVRSWLIDTVSDAFGNQVQYRYTEDNATGESYPRRIDWGEQVSGAQEGERRYRLHFVWAERPDSDRWSAYRSGAKSTITKRLRSIRSQRHDGGSYQFLRIYKLAYEAPGSDDSGRSRLASVQVCDTFGGDCLPLTRFDWQRGSAGWPATGASSQTGASEVGTSRVGDINNDGREDILIASEGPSPTWSVMLSYGSALIESPTSVSALHAADSYLIDYNGDAAMDLMVPQEGTWRVYLADGNIGLTPVAVDTEIPADGLSFGVRVADFNGDGLHDLLYGLEDGLYLRYRDPNHTFTAPEYVSGQFLVDDAAAYYTHLRDARLIDFDGDGRNDVILRTSTVEVPGVPTWSTPGGCHDFTVDLRWSSAQGVTWDVEVRENAAEWSRLLTDHPATSYTHNAGLGTFDYQVRAKNELGIGGGWSTPPLAVFTEVNGCGGDGPPVAPTAQDPVSGDWTLLRYEGGSFAAMATLSDVANPLPIDLNGDGLTDLAYARNGTWHTRLSTGTSLTEEVDSDFSSALAANAFVVDADRDGREDLVYYRRANNMIDFVVLRSDGEGLGALATALTVDDIANYDDPGRIRIFDGNGDGYRDIAYYNSTTSTWTVHTHNSAPADLLTRITDGFAKPGGGDGNEVLISYAPLPDVPGYFSSDATFPLERNYCGPMRVVTTVTRNDGVGGDYTQTYSYSNGKISTEGRGFLGFRYRQVRDTRDMPDVWALYRQDFPFTGLVEEQGISQKLGSTPVERVETAHASVALTHPGGGVSHMVWAHTQQTDRHEVGGPRNGAQVTRTVVETREADINTNPEGFGEVLKATITVDPIFTGDTHTTVVESSYQSRADDPCLLPHRISITRSEAGVSVTRASQAIEVDWQSCRVVEFHENVDSDPQVRKTRVEHDHFGNVVRHELWGGDGSDASNGPRRVTAIEYDAAGQLPLKVTEDPSGLALEQRLEWDYNLGLLRRSTDYAGLQRELYYDSFGRPTQSIAPDGSYLSTVYDWCDGANGKPYACKEHGVALTRQTRFSPTFPGGVAEADTQLVLDAYGRLVGEYSNSGGSADHYPGLTYRFDARGNLIQRSTPTPRSRPPSHWVSMDYDLIRRVVATTRPVDQYGRYAESTIEYLENEVIVTDGMGAQRRLTLDGLGRTVAVTDPDPATGLLSASVTRYAYTPFSELASITDAHHHVTTFTYDGLGHTRTLDDPNSGLWGFDYNVFGEVTRQHSPKAQAVTFDYDATGRITYRAHEDFWTEWEYDSAPGASRGQIHTIRYEPIDGVVETETFAYDAVGRQSSRTSAVMGTGTSFTYDEYSRLKSITYPTFDSADPYAVTYAYDGRGRVAAVDDSNGVRVFEISPSWPFEFSGQLGNFRLGNGVSSTNDYDDASGVQSVSKSVGATGVLVHRDRAQHWDNNLSVIERKDTQYDGVRGVFDIASYDYLDRMSSVETKRGGTTLDTVYVDYDAIGNIQSKSDVGDYQYAPGSPSRLSAITNGPRDLSFTYDEHGNVLTKAETSTQTSTQWTSFDQPREIARGADVVTFAYNSALEPLQVIQDAADEPDTVGHWYYTDGLSTYRFDRNAHVYRIPVEGVVIGATDSANGAVTYYHYDLLGSVVTTTDESGGLAAEMRFDAFGKRRLLNGNADVNDTLLFGQEDDATPGFTGHQQRNIIGLVQMNARVYDPTVARFQSVDPVMRDLTDSRSHNAYSYVENNPLSYTDPTGLALDGAGGSSTGGGGVDSGATALFSFALELALVNERRAALEEYFVVSARLAELDMSGGPPTAALLADSYTTETGFFDQPLGVPGRIGVAAVGGAATVGVGALIASSSAAVACVSSIVCGVTVVAVVGGVTIYDLSHGGAGRIRDSFVAFFTSDTVTLGQSLEVGVISSAAAGGVGLRLLPRRASPTLTHQNGIYEVLSEQFISGSSRSAHRASANRALLQAIESDSRFASDLSQLLGSDDVALFMRSGRSQLRNPPATEWHHPLDNPAVMQLLRREVHRHSELREILHPENIGGFGHHFGE